MILYIIRWTFIYILLIYLLHNLYLFFQDNLTTTKNKDFYNNISIEPIHTNSGETINPNPNPNLNPNSSKDLNSDFTYQMKYELNDFINKIKV
jgi:hypothetical protein